MGVSGTGFPDLVGIDESLDHFHQYIEYRLRVDVIPGDEGDCVGRDLVEASFDEVTGCQHHVADPPVCRTVMGDHDGARALDVQFDGHDFLLRVFEVAAPPLRHSTKTITQKYA